MTRVKRIEHPWSDQAKLLKHKLNNSYNGGYFGLGVAF